MPEVIQERFRLVKKIGEGGTGEVFQARDLRLQRDVAIKRLAPAPPERLPRLRRRLLKEAENLAGIEHPNVVVVHDVLESDDSVAIVMELVQGTPLLKKFRKKALGEDEYVGYLRQLILALESVHELGLIHRDINPKNVLVTRQGIIKLIDFGLSCRFDEDNPRTGGTIGYMAPEAMRRGGRISFGIDIYSLGFLSYQALLGVAAFKRYYGTSRPKEWMRWVLSREPFKPLRELEPRVFQGLSAIIGRMIEKDLAKRYAKISDVRADLEAYLDAKRKFRGLPAAPADAKPSARLGGRPTDPAGDRRISP